MSTIQEQIDILQEQIDAIQGNVAGVTPATCNIAALETTVQGLQNDIRNLTLQQMEEAKPFKGTTMNLRFGSDNMPIVTGTNQAGVALYRLVMQQMGVTSLPTDSIQLQVSGNSTVTFMGVGGASPVEVAAQMSSLFKTIGVKVDVTQASKVKNDNVQRAAPYTDIAEMQSNVIEEFFVESPVLSTPSVVTNGLEAEVTFTCTGDDIEYTMQWEGAEDEAVDIGGSPATHNYTTAGTYEAILTAENTGGTDTKVIQIVVEED